MGGRGRRAPRPPGGRDGGGCVDERLWEVGRAAFGEEGVEGVLVRLDDTEANEHGGEMRSPEGGVARFGPKHLLADGDAELVEAGDESGVAGVPIRPQSREQVL